MTYAIWVYFLLNKTQRNNPHDFKSYIMKNKYI